jgi:ankyrin repeat protein
MHTTHHLAAALALAAAVVAGCETRESPPTAPVARAPSAAPAQQNLAMGTGEARDPQPFTREQRLLDAVQRNDRATIERALELGVPVGTRDDLGRSALALAVSDARDLELARWLQTKGAVVDEPDVQGRAAVSFAAANGDVEIVRWLADQKAEIDRPDWLQRTPLFHAALNDRPEVVALLLDRGADANARDQFGDTPLIVACAKGNAAVATVLLARGADPTLKDQEGRTARERSAPGTTPCGAP